MPKKLRKRLTNRKNYNRELAAKKEARKAAAAAAVKLVDEGAFPGNVVTNSPLLPTSHLIQTVSERVKKIRNEEKRMKYWLKKNIKHSIEKLPLEQGCSAQLENQEIKEMPETPFKQAQTLKLARVKTESYVYEDVTCQGSEENVRVFQVGQENEEEVKMIGIDQESIGKVREF